MSSIKDCMRKVLKNDFVQGLLVIFAMSLAISVVSYLAFIISDFVESF